MNVDEESSNRRPTPWIGVACVLLITFLAYLPVWNLEFTNWDDDKYVTENPLIRELSGENIKSFFGFFEGNFHPLTLLSLALDFRLAGLSPRLYHVTNLLLHLLNTLLVFRLVRLLFGNATAALLAAALFGVHTFHVESVAWISARKDLLYALFFFSALICYVNFVRDRKGADYLKTVCLFLLSLGSKGMAVSLPLILISIDYLENRNLLDRKVILEKIPFLLISFGIGMLAVSGQASATAIQTNVSFSWFDRLVMAGFQLFEYFIKVIVPVHLSSFYPHPGRAADIPSWFVVSAGLAALIVIATLLTIRFSKKYIFGFAFFFCNIVLVLKLIPVGDTIIADRYSYVASLGIILMMAAAYQDLVKWNVRSQKALQLVFGAYLFALGILTYQRCAVWQDSISLWDDVLAKYPNASKPLLNRGYAKHYLGDNAGSLQDFDRAIALDPEYADAYYNRAGVKIALKDMPGAVADWTQAIALNPGYADAYYNRGSVFHVSGDLHKAIEDYDQALKVKPDLAVAWYARGIARLNLGDAQGACENLQKAQQFGDPNAAAVLEARCR